MKNLIFRIEKPEHNFNLRPIHYHNTDLLILSFRAIMTHASVPKSDRDVLGISDTLIRLSVGLEDKKDLLDDLDQALKAAVSLIILVCFGA